MSRQHSFAFRNGNHGIPVVSSPLGFMFILHKSTGWHCYGLKHTTPEPMTPVLVDVVNPQTSLEKLKSALDVWLRSGGMNLS